MRPSRIKSLWAEGKPVLNGWLSIANAFSAEIMAEQGYDSITIDLQHGVVDYQAMVGMLRPCALARSHLSCVCHGWIPLL